MSGYVDLGLPSGTLWATHNVGADKPTDFGWFFSWGSVEPYKEGVDSTDNYFGGSFASTIQTNLTGYNDAATYNWGTGWRLPTYAEEVELKDNCTWTWQTNYEGSGHNGYVVTGPNGNSIFLPAAGNLYGLSLGNVGSYGHYWSSSFYSSSYCWDLNFDSSDRHIHVNWRYNGFSVRPVKDNSTSPINFGYNSLNDLVNGANCFISRGDIKGTEVSSRMTQNGVWMVYNTLREKDYPQDNLYGFLLSFFANINACQIFCSSRHFWFRITWGSWDDSSWIQII